MPFAVVTASPTPLMFLAWTTVANQSAATALASRVVELGLAACVQIDGPIVSIYRWEGRIESATEFRLTFKCLAPQLPALENHVLNHHPYDTPEWLAVPIERIGEKYLSWAGANSSTPPL